ncbi:hypothetical protein J4438_03900 [Candidatus Woesearchaeota archaeon]|nr:hypothetical protein [Candidatus Woesearchaeota archaeon]
MKNIQRLANHITKYGEKGLMVHTIYGTTNWILCQKIEKEKWSLSLENPMGNTSYNLGIVSEDQHAALWTELIKTEIEKKASNTRTANELRNKVNYFIKNHEKNYKNFLKEKIKLNKKHEKIITMEDACLI